ncbi:MAG: Crp/Fnr family transcriptional regulator [Candidatus Nanopelagicaceae bacterium]
MTPRANDQIDEIVVRKAPIFSGLDEAAASTLRSSMSLVKLRKGQSLFKEGDDGDHLFIVSNGKVKLGTKSPDGRENLLMILGPGDMFGDLSLFDSGPRTSTATAVTDTKLLSLGQDKVIPWVKEHPEVSLHLLARLASRLRRTNEVVGDLVFSDVPGRVAKALIDLGVKFGDKREEGLFVNHDLTQEELAQLVGASRETVNKALADFAQRGWLRLEARSVMILDYERMLKRGR